MLASGGQKPQFCANFDILGAPVPTPFYQWGPNLVCYSRPKVYTYKPNFIWMCSFVSASSGQRRQFWANFDIFGSSCTDPFYRWGPNLVCHSRHTLYVYLRNFVSIGLFCRPVAAKNPNFCRFLGLRHLVVLPIGSSLRNTGAQLQTYPCPTVSKSCLYSNSFMAKSGAQSLTFKSVTYKRTNRQTNKKLNVFGCPGGGWNPSPTKVGMMIEDLEHVLAPLKRLGSDA